MSPGVLFTPGCSTGVHTSLPGRGWGLWRRFSDAFLDQSEALELAWGNPLEAFLVFAGITGLLSYVCLTGTVHVHRRLDLEWAFCFTTSVCSMATAMSRDG